MTCNLRDWITLLRPWCYQHYAVIIFGVVLFRQQVSRDIFVDLMIGGASLPLLPYAIVFAFMLSVQSVKFRIEANASAAFDSRVKGAPLELCATLFFIACGAMLPAVDQPGVKLWLLLSVLSFAFFVVGPVVEPRIAILFGVTMPHPPKPNLRLRIARALLAVGDYAGLCKFGAFSAFSLLNHFLMGLEESLFPCLLAPQADNIHFVVGHQRSGTTALHEAVLRHDRAIGCTFFDIWCPSLAMKVLGMPLRRLMEAVLSRHDSANHRIKIDEPSEEHVFCLHQCRTFALFAVFPALMRHPDMDLLLRDALEFGDAEVHFMQRCIQRTIVAARLTSGRRDVVYVARPLSMTKDVDALRRRFPRSKLVVCVREARAAVRSWVQLCAIASNASLHDPSFQALMRSLYTQHSQPTLDAVFELVGADRRADTHAVMFEGWQTQPAETLSGVLAHLFGSHVEARDVAPLIQPAEVGHKNDPFCERIVHVDQQLADRYHHIARRPVTRPAIPRCG